MADTILHLQATLGGGYKTADAEDQPEVWQCGLRFWIGHSAPDPVGNLVATYNVVEDEQTVTETDYTVTSNWRLEGGVNDFDPVSWLVDQGRNYAAAFCNNEVMSAYAQVWWIKLAVIGTDGRQIPPPGFGTGTPALLTYSDSARPNGNGSSNTLPLQCSVVASHVTAQTGKKGKGRQYLPAVDQNNLTAGGRLNSAGVSSIVAAQVAALEAASIAIAGETFMIPSVISNTGSGGAIDLTKYATIQRVRVGDVIDTQRRRRNKLVEAYTYGDVSYG